MKTKKEILNMTKKELLDYKWSNDLDKKEENSKCSNCSDCSDCSYCSDCYGCRNLKDKKYCICNVQLTKEEYEKKIKEVKDGNI